ncbi:hypothetical protein ER308_20505 [Egibacter rhizosphaerae]|uniref:Uncharacterized protein n=1 Tax=Egibacter rhizosphaerae TaxID=1670831 RepID=A0A411YKK2_9ACTN|nr:cell wall-binding repeat-containing protein [Egibacter rhizosphaerae]QBI21713.1 hypothetical protein ER308_20505 [Egibacter rhizosphaerae]
MSGPPPRAAALLRRPCRRAWAVAVTGLVLAGPALVTSAPLQAAPSDPGTDAHDAEAQSTGEVLVRFDDDLEAAETDDVLAATDAARAVDPRAAEVAEIDVIEPRAGEVEALAERLDDHPATEYAEPNWIVRSLDERNPNDPAYPRQWGLARIEAPGAWHVTTGDPDVTVAIVDSGVDTGHEDLQEATAEGRNFIDGDDDTEDAHGHGTLTAGVAAARTDNLRGIAGVCWRCELLPVRVLDDDGEGTAAELAAGIRYSADEGAQVINLSLGSSERSQTVARAIDDATEAGSLVVAAAGNAGDTERIYPAAHEHTLAVAGSDEEDRRYPWSTHGDWVDLAAPGCNISTSIESSSAYATFCGTSSASPVVAGVAALLFSDDADATNDTVADGLTEHAAPVEYVRHGRVDADAAVRGHDSDPEPGNGDDEGVATTRYSGANRYETAAETARGTFPDEVERVYVATGERFPDALAAGPASAVAAGPVLLTRGDTLPEATARELERLRPEGVVVSGGPSAISDDVLLEIAGAASASTRRVYGADRYETAAELAADGFSPEATDRAYVGTGEQFPDALATTPPAAADGAPLLLTAADRLPAATREALGTLDVDEIVVVGGHAAVSASVEETLAELADTERVAGRNRYETAAELARRAHPASAERALLATGGAFADGLAGGPAAVRQEAPLLLTPADGLAEPTGEALAGLQPDLVAALGGERAVSEQTLEEAARSASMRR